MAKTHIAVLSEEKDLHALLVQRALAAHRDIVCHLVSVDRICDRVPLIWSNCAGPAFRPSIVTADGDRLWPGEVDLVWWRRFNPPQEIPPDIENPNHIRLIHSDSHAAVTGLFLTEFRGKWINDIRAARVAENKLVQLRAAQSVGLRVPQTLVSNDPDAIRNFCASLGHRVVVKAVRGTRGCHLFTRMVDEEHLASDACLRLSPAIYQEAVPGSVHLRVHCFGDAVHAVAIESGDLDWRENLDVPFTVVTLEQDLQSKLRAVLKVLGLRMGIIDLKISPNDGPVWLEINSQGQFLFSEGLSGLDLTAQLADFLAAEARGA